MRIHRTTPEDIWNRATVARRVQRERHSDIHKTKGINWGKARLRARAYFAKMRGMPATPGQIYPLEVAWSFIGSLVGIGLLSWCGTELFHDTNNTLLIGTFGASAMLLFGAPQSPFAQPRNVIGGHVVSAFIGISVLHLLGGTPHLTPALAVSGAIAAMHLTGTLHPPGGGTALLMVTGCPAVDQYGFFTVLFPVATGMSTLVLVALFINNLARDRRYPASWW